MRNPDPFTPLKSIPHPGKPVASPGKRDVQVDKGIPAANTGDILSFYWLKR
jgi:hypothetical protein